MITTISNISIEVNCPVYYFMVVSSLSTKLTNIFESVIANQKDSRFDESLQFQNSDDDVLHPTSYYDIMHYS